MADGPAEITAFIASHHRQCVRALQRIAAMADPESQVHREFAAPYLRMGDSPTGWRIVEVMRDIAIDCIGNEPLAKPSDAHDSEPAWVTRLAQGNTSMSPFAASEIARQVRELLVYQRAMEAMAAQYVCPKTTPQELAEQILKKGT